MTAGKSIAALPHALRDRDELTRQFGGRRPAVFLDYDGTSRRSVPFTIVVEPDA